MSAIPFGDHAYCVGAESAITPADYLAEWPAGYSAAEAAATWMQYCTAYFPLKELTPVGRGDTVLVSAASSSARPSCVKSWPPTAIGGGGSTGFAGFASSSGAGAASTTTAATAEPAAGAGIAEGVVVGALDAMPVPPFAGSLP